MSQPPSFLRSTLRSLLKRPALSLLVVLSLALGIGCNTAIFSLVKVALFEDLPYSESGRLVRIWETFKYPGGRGRGSVSVPNLVDWQAQARSFTGIGAYSVGSAALAGGGEAVQLPAAAVTPELFSVLGVAPARGRAFAAGENRPGADAVVLLSDALWRKSFGARPEAVGQTVTLDGRTVTVIGVMPPSFRFPPTAKADLWTPLTFSPGQEKSRGSHWLSTVARLAPGQSLEAARSEIELLTQRLVAAYPAEMADRGVTLLPLEEATFGSLRTPLLLLWLAAGLVFLISCGNVANLLLTAAIGRRRELALRSALGASPGQLAGGALLESLLLALPAAILGLLLAQLLLEGVVPQANLNQPLLEGVRIDLRVALFCVASSLLAAVLAGLAPAWRMLRNSPQLDLSGSSKGAVGAGREKARPLLVTGQMALAQLVLAGTLVVVGSLLGLRAVSPGFAQEHALSFHLALPDAKYRDASALTSTYDLILSRLAALPGVEAAGMIDLLPVQNFGNNGNFGVEGYQPPQPGMDPFAEFRAVSPGLFPALGVALRAGRDFNAGDNASAPAVVMVNRVAAERYWPGKSPVGRRVSSGDPAQGGSWLTVVGVVDNTRSAGLSREPEPELYAPFAQQPGSEMVLVVRTAGSPTTVAAAVRKVVAEVDPQVPIFQLKTLHQVVSDSLSRWTSLALLLGVAALLALLLALGGLYGLLSHSVAQRVQEFGIRLALGSQKGEILQLVLRQGLRLCLVGALVGGALAAVFSKTLTSQLSGVATVQPLAFVGATFALLAVAALACLLPARRATEADPIRSIRGE